MSVITAAGIGSWWANDRTEDGMISAVFVTPDFTEATLAAAYLAEADLTGARVDRADLTAAFLEGADLSGMTGTDANLSQACLRHTKWDAAELLNVDLTRADISGADLSRARSITVKSTSGLVVDDGTRLPVDASWTGLVRRSESTDDNGVC
jgi:uncharacterized protein YjbI with pentapeptide repeats